jgi:hypothetical protein
VASRRRNWEAVIPFFAFSPEVRRIVYITNAIESLHNEVLERDAAAAPVKAMQVAASRFARHLCVVSDRVERRPARHRHPFATMSRRGRVRARVAAATYRRRRPPGKAPARARDRRHAGGPGDAARVPADDTGRSPSRGAGFRGEPTRAADGGSGLDSTCVARLRRIHGSDLITG